MNELQTLYALAAERRAAGLPCNPHRDGLTDLDWLSLNEIDRVHALGLQAAIVQKLVAA